MAGYYSATQQHQAAASPADFLTAAYTRLGAISVLGILLLAVSFTVAFIASDPAREFPSRVRSTHQR